MAKYSQIDDNITVDLPTSDSINNYNISEDKNVYAGVYSTGTNSFEAELEHENLELLIEEDNKNMILDTSLATINLDNNTAKAILCSISANNSTIRRSCKLKLYGNIGKNKTNNYIQINQPGKILLYDFYEATGLQNKLLTEIYLQVRNNYTGSLQSFIMGYKQDNAIHNYKDDTDNR